MSSYTFVDNYNKGSNLINTYFFVFSILAITGFEFFFRAGYLIIPISLYAFIIFISKIRSIDKGFVIMFLFINILTLLQTVFGFNRSIYSSILFAVSLSGCYFISKISGSHFVKAFINIVFIISLISLPVFSLTFYTPFLDFVSEKVSIYFVPLSYNSVTTDLNNEGKNILIYNFMNYSFLYNRNSGPFWEPGIFAIFLNIALFFNIINENKLFSIVSFILILTILTTFSTTGYIGLLFILVVYILFYSTSRFKFLYILALIIPMNYIVNLDFMQDKVLEQIEVANKSGSSRFGALLVHLKLIYDFPLIGVGDGVSRYVANYTEATSTANGISIVFVKYGIPFGIIYYVLLLKSCVNIISVYLFQKRKILGYSFFFLLLILSFSQDITVRVFYFLLIIWGLFVPIQTVRIRKEYSF